MRAARCFGNKNEVSVIAEHRRRKGGGRAVN